LHISEITGIPAREELRLKEQNYIPYGLSVPDKIYASHTVFSLNALFIFFVILAVHRKNVNFHMFKQI